MTENTLRQADNNVKIEGLLLENNLETATIGADNKEVIRGSVDIEVAENEVHTVEAFMPKYKKDGSENGVYKGLETVMNEYKSVASHGREEADKIRITNGELRKNEYIGGDGQLKSYPQINSNFFNRLTEKDDYEPKAEFAVEAIVTAVREEIKNEEETGRAILETMIPLYGGKLVPFEFVVAEDGADYVMDNYEKGNTVEIKGNIVNYQKVETFEKEMAFGSNKKETKTTTVREYLVTGGTEPYEEDNPKAYKADVIKKAWTERELFIEELKKKKEEKDKNGSSGGKKMGFDTKAKKDDDNPKIKSDDLPF